MKQILFLIFLISPNILGQVIISPFIIYMDQRERFGTFIVQNESLDEFEINISFVFGYPDSDSLGNISMTYHEEPNDSLPSIVEWLRAFPRSFILNPNQKQIVRMSKLNLSKANNDARNGEKLGKLEGEESIIIKFKFSSASKNAAIKGIKVT